MHGKEVKMKEELIILVEQVVSCDLTQEQEAGFGERSILTQSIATFWFCDRGYNSASQVSGSSSVIYRFGLDDL